MLTPVAVYRFFQLDQLELGDHAMFMFSSSRSTTAIRLGFPATFEVGVRDPVRRVSSCRLASTRGSLHQFALFLLAVWRCAL